MPTAELAIERNPSAEDVEYLEDRLYEFNTAATDITDGQLIAIFVRDEAGQIVAGIAGNTWGEACEIRQLWVEESRRKQGLGSKLLAAVEAEAIRTHCRQIFLTTHSFQAPGFYAKHGFEVLYTLTDKPVGHQLLLLRKTLSQGQ